MTTIKNIIKNKIKNKIKMSKLLLMCAVAIMNAPSMALTCPEFSSTNSQDTLYLDCQGQGLFTGIDLNKIQMPGAICVYRSAVNPTNHSYRVIDLPLNLSSTLDNWEIPREDLLRLELSAKNQKNLLWQQGFVLVDFKGLSGWAHFTGLGLNAQNQGVIYYFSITDLSCRLIQ